MATTPIVFSEARIDDSASSSAHDNTVMTEAAALAGFRVYHIPSDFTECDGADNALWHVPEQAIETLAIWVGFIPSFERYEELYEAALRKHIRLVNSPDEHRNVLEFDRSLSRLGQLTPETVVIESPDQVGEAARRLGFPLFLRGSVRSRKESGWSACVAETATELAQHVAFLFAWPYRSRGRVLARKLIRLKHSRTSDNGFPIGREFRVFVLHNEVVGMGYYWEGADPLAALTLSERSAVYDLAIEAARRVATPFQIVDIGQDVDDRWWVVEVGDAQFAGHGQTPVLALWQHLFRSLSESENFRLAR